MYCYNSEGELDLTRIPVQTSDYDRETGEGFDAAMEDREIASVAEQIKALRSIPEDKRTEEDIEDLAWLEDRAAELATEQEENPGFGIIVPKEDDEELEYMEYYGDMNFEDDTPEDPAF